MPEGQFITMNRILLYNEIWDVSATGVAKKYNIPYAELLRICKEVQIPIPPSGYWVKLSFGKLVEKIPLPESPLSDVMLHTNDTSKSSKNSSIFTATGKVKAEKIDTNEQPFSINQGISEKVESKSFDGIKEAAIKHQLLAFLLEDECQKVLLATDEIKILNESIRLHKKIATYSSKVKEWNKNDKKPQGAKRSLKNYSIHPPFLAGVISNETLPRVYRILDALYRKVEMLGGSVNDDLSLTIRNEHVSLEIFEAQDEIKHQITKQEAQQLIIYKDAKRHNRWASEPNIRKYDYVFNGKLRICIRKSRYFRDSEKEKIESRLGDMLIELYEESEVVRKKREDFEEAKRKEEEEKRLREERKIRYNEEVDRTISLTNMAKDYDIACKIRAYTNALEESENIDDKAVEMIDWAKKKADWFDPTVARTDEFFGKREHRKNEEEKYLKKSGYYWW